MKKPVVFVFLIGGIFLVLSIGAAIVRAQEEQPPAVSTTTFYLPSILSGNLLSGHHIRGRVVNADNVPLVGVTITLDSGRTAVTNVEGYYTIAGLEEDTYTLTPSLPGVIFSPPSASVVVPPDVIHLNFVAAVDCSEGIVNGGFENSDGWELPITAYPAAYSTDQAHSGARSLRTGITNPADNTYSYSSGRQGVTIPAGSTGAVLRFWIKPYSGEALGQTLPPSHPTGSAFGEQILSGDVQYVLILDQYNNWIDTIVWQLSDSRTWTYYEVSLVQYAGRTIKIHFGTYNDGYGGVSAMYVDDVSLQICPGSGATPAPTNTPPPGSCGNLIQNPGFETISDWEIPVTRYPANYATAQAHSGVQSMRTGIIDPDDNIYSYSDFRQRVTIPAGAPAAILRFWLYPLSGENLDKALPPSTPTKQPFGKQVLSSDVQYVLILDRYQYWIDTLVWQRSDTGSWGMYQFDLRRYAGQTIYIQFGTYNDGYDGVTAMYVDDVTLDTCLYTPTPSLTPSITPTPTQTPLPTSTPTPTSSPTPTNTPLPTNTPPPTSTPGPCENLFINSDFEDDDGWEIINTAYKAAYSTEKYHSPIRSMRTGIVNPYHNIYSYSDFRQTVSIPLDADTVTLGTWIYPISGESPLQPLPPPPQAPFFGLAPLDYDVQYILILDRWDNWIDTLLWQRSDSRMWVYMEFPLDDYAGWVIKIQFGTYNNGTGGITAMYVDDTTLEVCR